MFLGGGFLQRVVGVEKGRSGSRRVAVLSKRVIHVVTNGEATAEGVQITK